MRTQLNAGVLETVWPGTEALISAAFPAAVVWRLVPYLRFAEDGHAHPERSMHRRTRAAMNGHGHDMGFAHAFRARKH